MPKALVGAIIGALVAIGVGALIAGDLNLMHWHIALRAIIAIAAVVFAFLGMMIGGAYHVSHKYFRDE